MIRDGVTPQSWHVLTESSVPIAEFSLALSRFADVTTWVPRMSGFAWIHNQTCSQYSDESNRYRRVYFPLQRGFSRFSVGPMAATYGNIYALLMKETQLAERTALICTSSFYAPVAQMWRGPVIYYATDFTFAYQGLSSERVLLADRAMCAVADFICPNSARLAAYFIDRCGCPAERVTIIPNATRAGNLRSSASSEPGALPWDVPPMSRPIAGVIGNMAGNLDWKMLAEVIEQVPSYSWLFVGPSSMSIREKNVRTERTKVMKMARTRFIGPRPYRDLVQYARAIDVAVMPYRKQEPTYSGSATRFYEHLAAGRPIISTRGVEELLHKEPFLSLVDTAAEMAQKLEIVKTHGGDGYEGSRLVASQSETWERRAETMVSLLSQNTMEANVHLLRSGATHISQTLSQ